MPRLSKSATLTIRFTPEQRRKIAQAARIASRLKGEIVEESTLFRELGMREIEQYLAAQTEAPAAASA